MQHLYHTNIKRNENLYLEKGVSQDYVSKFLSYDKHTVKKKAFFYYNLIKLKNGGKNNQTKFLSAPKLEKKKSSLLNKKKKKKFFLLSSKIPQICTMYNLAFTSKYTSYLNLGITSHTDAYKGYKKGKVGAI
jgi:hypothetical protein